VSEGWVKGRCWALVVKSLALVSLRLGESPIPRMRDYEREGMGALSVVGAKVMRIRVAEFEELFEVGLDV